MNQATYILLQQQAKELRQAIESNLPEADIGRRTRTMIETLGGTANISNMTPGAAAIYLFALMIMQTHD